MGRGISFDYDRAIDRATRQFWRTGYAGTSLRDLLAATGLGEGSFYNTLKSKKQLYLSCLQHYAETEGRRRIAALNEAQTAGAGVRGMFAAMLDCLDDPETPSKICMMAGMFTESVFADADLQAFAVEGHRQFEAVLTNRLEAGRAAGDLPEDLDAAMTASVIITYSQGLWYKALVHYDRAEFERQIERFLSGLGLAA